ncbi:VanZ family protein [Streptomyces sp. NPDC002643]
MSVFSIGRIGIGDFGLDFLTGGGSGIGAAIALGPLLAGFGLLVAVLARRGTPGWTGAHAVTRLLTAAYVAGVLALAVFPVLVTYGTYGGHMAGQLESAPQNSFGASLLANLALMLPLGMLLPLLYSRATTLERVTGLAVTSALALEMGQHILYIAGGDPHPVMIGDIIGGTFGGLIGYIVLSLALRVPAVARLLLTLALPGSAMATVAQAPRRGLNGPGRPGGTGDADRTDRTNGTQDADGAHLSYS